MSPLNPQRRRRTIIQTVSLGLVVLIAGGVYSLLSARYNEEGLYANAEQLLLQGKHREAMQVLEHLLTNFPYGEYHQQALIDAANTYNFYLRNVPRAIELYRALIDNRRISREKKLEARERLAEIYNQDVGDPEKALAEYLTLRQEQQAPQAIQKSSFQIASLYLKKNQFDTALKEFQHVAQSNSEPDLRERALLKISGIYVLQGKAADAEPVFQEVLKSSKSEDTIHQAKLGLIDVWESTDKFDKAIGLLADMKGDQAFEDFKIAELKRLKEKAGILKNKVQIPWTSSKMKTRT
jgi:outer membrane protein assembly factor BamD (BamD/ComL family)